MLSLLWWGDEHHKNQTGTDLYDAGGVAHVNDQETMIDDVNPNSFVEKRLSVTPLRAAFGFNPGKTSGKRHSRYRFAAMAMNSGGILKTPPTIPLNSKKDIFL